MSFYLHFAYFCSSDLRFSTVIYIRRNNYIELYIPVDHHTYIPAEDLGATTLPLIILYHYAISECDVRYRSFLYGRYIHPGSNTCGLRHTFCLKFTRICARP